MTPRDPPGGCHDHKPWAVAGTDPGDSAPRSSTTGCTRPRQGSNKIDAKTERRTRQASGNCRQSCGQTRVTDAQEEAALGAEGAPSRRQGGPRRASPHLLHDSPPPVRHQQPEPSSVGGLSDPCPRQAQTLSQGPAILWGPPRLRSLSDSASRWKVVHTVSRVVKAQLHIIHFSPQFQSPSAGLPFKHLHCSLENILSEIIHPPLSDRLGPETWEPFLKCLYLDVSLTSKIQRNHVFLHAQSCQTLQSQGL